MDWKQNSTPTPTPPELRSGAQQSGCLHGFATPASSQMGTPTKIECKFDKPLRDYQEEIIGAYLSNVGHKDGEVSAPQSPSGGIIQVGCGMGKTVMSIKILSMIGLKTFRSEEHTSELQSH